VPPANSIAAYVREHNAYIARAVGAGVAFVAIAAHLADKSEGHWTAAQILKSIYAGRHKSKLRGPTPDEAAILEQIEAGAAVTAAGVKLSPRAPTTHTRQVTEAERNQLAALDRELPAMRRLNGTADSLGSSVSTAERPKSSKRDRLLD
jgi:hypothetical protein